MLYSLRFFFNVLYFKVLFFYLFFRVLFFIQGSSPQGPIPSISLSFLVLFIYSIPSISFSCLPFCIFPFPLTSYVPFHPFHIPFPLSLSISFHPFCKVLPFNQISSRLYNNYRNPKLNAIKCLMFTQQIILIASLLLRFKSFLS